MVEKTNYRSFLKLSPVLTGQLVQGEITPDTIEKIQSELLAYFDHDAKTFGGVLYDREGKGAEKPYFKPEGDDWQPEVQAISRIGVQYHYWDTLRSSLESAKIDPVKMMSMVILVVHMNPDGSSFLETNSDPEAIKQIALTLKIEDKISSFQRYVTKVNYGGDADFYGPWHNAIFPMDVRTPDSQLVYVKRETLGLPVDVVENTWQSWRDLNKTKEVLYHQATLASFKGLPPATLEIIEEGLSRDEKYGGEWKILRALLKKDRFMADEILDESAEIINQKAREIMTKNPTLLEASRNLAENLRNMYETAKAKRRDIYSYS